MCIMSQRLFAINDHDSGFCKASTNTEKTSYKLELNDFVTQIDTLYNKNEYHSFEHAAHVLLSMNILIDMIVAEHQRKARQSDPSFPQRENMQCNESSEKENVLSVIGQNKRIHFALVFAALIHDIDHRGVSNQQLIEEKHDLTQKYSESIAERNSLSIAFSLLKKDCFVNLRKGIARTSYEMEVFEATVADIVLGTDIASQDRRNQDDDEWSCAFGDHDKHCTIGKSTGIVNECSCSNMNDKTSLRVKAALKMLIKAADIAPNMQEWRIFTRWSHNLFVEENKAYVCGRVVSGTRNPAENWYDNQLAFFDFYVIPLAQRMKDSGLFGDKGDIFLINVRRNHRRWFSEGKKLCNGFKYARQA